MSIDLNTFRKAHLFNADGTWKYDVWLHYGNADDFDYESWDLWSEARKAFRRATEMGASGVVMADIHPGWMLIVPGPVSKYEHPIMVIGEQ